MTTASSFWSIFTARQWSFKELIFSCHVWLSVSLSACRVRGSCTGPWPIVSTGPHPRHVEICSIWTLLYRAPTPGHFQTCSTWTSLYRAPTPGCVQICATWTCTGTHWHFHICSLCSHWILGKRVVGVRLKCILVKACLHGVFTFATATRLPYFVVKNSIKCSGCRTHSFVATFEASHF